MSGQIWFGNLQHMQWVPAPLVGAQVSNAGYHASIDFENGGSDSIRSVQYHKLYTFNYNALMDSSEDIGVFGRFATGFYGDGLIYFTDPFAATANLLPANWASPALIEQGWSNIYDVAPTFSDTTSYGTYAQPFRSATFNITTASGSQPARTIVVAIPPNATLKLGFSGSVTGTGGVFYRTVASGDGVTYGTPTAITALAVAGSARTNVSLAGSSYKAVQIYLGRSSSAASTVTVTSMIAQLSTTVVTGNHRAGEGHSGLVFDDDAIVENYGYLYPPRKGLSTTLREVGAWR
jgi:hypothetical protein